MSTESLPIYAVVKMTYAEWRDLTYRSDPATIATTEAILSADELRGLNMWHAADEMSR